MDPLELFKRRMNCQDERRGELADAVRALIKQERLSSRAAAKRFDVKSDVIECIRQVKEDALPLGTLVEMLETAGATVDLHIKGATETKEARVQLRHSVVVFLDLLGFTNRMRQTADDSDKSQKLLEDYDRVIGGALADLEDAKSVFAYRGFTDSFLISIPLFDLHPEESVGWSTMLIAQFQLSLSLEGWFVRGGLGMGPFYMDDRIVFGPGLIKAYDLESKEAVYPRVILDDEALAHTCEHLRYYGDPFGDAPQNDLVIVDEDGRALVNYLYRTVEYGWDDHAEDALSKHRRVVEAAMVATEDSRVTEKYQWVAAYHNFFLSHWVPEAEHLRIDGAQERAFRRLVRSEEENPRFR